MHHLCFTSPTFFQLCRSWFCIIDQCSTVQSYSCTESAIAIWSQTVSSNYECWLLHSTAYIICIWQLTVASIYSTNMNETTGGSRHSAGGSHIDPDIRLERPN